MTFELVTVRRKIRKQIQFFFSESPLLIIVYISVLLQYTAIKCASGSYTCSNLYILKLASPALTSCDAFLPGGSPVDAFPFIGLLPLVLFFSDILPEFTSISSCISFVLILYCLAFHASIVWSKF